MNPEPQGDPKPDAQDRKANRQGDQHAPAAQQQETLPSWDALVDYLPEAIILESASRKILKVNQRFCDLLGLDESPEELQGMDGRSLLEKVKHLFAEKDRFQERTYEIIDAAIPARNLEHGLRDGRVLERDYIPMELRPGDVNHMWIYRDVSKSRYNKVVLSRSEHRFRSIFENANIGIAIADWAGGLLLTNPAFCKMLGYTEEELRNVHFSELIHPDDQESNLAESKRLRDGEILSFESENRYLHKSGKAVWVHKFVSCLYNDEGSPNQVLALVTDITERKQFELKIQSQNVRLSNILEGTNVGTWEWNIQTGEAVFNERWANIIGYTLEELSPVSIDTWIKYAHPEDLETSKELLEQHFNGQSDYYRCECRMKHKDGQWRWVLDRGKVISRSADGKPLWMFGTHQDITEHKKFEERLRHAQKQEAVGQLAGGVAHDFNNILSAIIGYAELLRADEPQGSFKENDLTEIIASAKRGAYITRQLLAFARADVVSPKTLTLDDPIENMLKMLRRLIGENIQLDFIPSPDPWQIRIDPNQIDQILVNLCVNARDAIDGNGTITIETQNMVLDETFCSGVETFTPGEYVMLEVSDDGAGMDSKTLQRIFEPFFTTKELGKGTGLGLATVYGIVHQNGGQINVYSEPGQGSSFKIYLPRTTEQIKTGSGQPEESARQPGGETILLVEDEPAVLNTGRRTLESLGYNVMAAQSPKEALEISQKFPDTIHLLLTDVIMPEMNGKQLADALLEMRPDIKVLFTSGYPEHKIASHGLLDSEVNFLQKPFERRILAQKLHEMLS